MATDDLSIKIPLQPCPRCKSPNVYLNERWRTKEEIAAGVWVGYFGNCGNCGLLGVEGTKKDAVFNWNITDVEAKGSGLSIH